MHVNRGLLGWGVFFIALGAVPLAVRGGALDAATASRAWELWPLLLIGAGLGLALRGSAFAPVGNIVVGLTFGLIGGALVVGGIGSAPVAFCGTGSSADSAGGSSRTGELRDGANVDLQVDCGTLTAVTQAGAAWSVAWPSGATTPRIDASDSRLGVEMGAQHGFAVGNPNARWTVALPSDATLNLSIAVNAGSATLRSFEGRVSSASVSVNAGSAQVNLAGASGLQAIDGSANAGSLTVGLPTPNGTLKGTFDTNAGSLRLCTPANVPLVIHVDESLGSNNFGQRGLAKSGDTWTRGVPGVGDARIELSVSASLGSVTLDPEDGCGG